ncbi:MAG: hypothetical protein JXA22_00685 [Candidatus Thermoplasmatota archaeon]|nr:hypothetical protein [Candidatus Thermoplasmatota archaeon]
MITQEDVEVTESKFNARLTILIVFISALAMISLIFGGILIYENLIYKEPKKGAVLEVEEVYFDYDGYFSEEYHISVKAFISNVGDEDCDMRIRAFAVDERSNLAMDDAETVSEVVKADSTIETSFEMTVIYNGTFTVELIIFKDDLITVKGYGKISLSDRRIGGKDYLDTVTDEPSEEKNGGNIPFPTIGAIIICILSVALAGAGYGKRRCRK